MKKIIIYLVMFITSFEFLVAQTVNGQLVNQKGFGLAGLGIKLYINPKIYETVSTSEGFFTFNNITDIIGKDLPTDYFVSENYPNPFNPRTRLNITLPIAGKVKLEVYNIIGQRIMSDSERYINSGNNYFDIILNGLPNGIYIAKITINDHRVFIRKLVLLYGSKHLVTSQSLSDINMNYKSISKLFLSTIIDSIIVIGSSIRQKITNLPSINKSSFDLGKIVINSITTKKSCPETPSVDYFGKNYKTVQIGSQCWLDENLDVGTMIHTNNSQENNGTIEKYCYANELKNCETYGGLYTWSEALKYEDNSFDHQNVPPTYFRFIQGICPDGWHIPTLRDFELLKSCVNNDVSSLLDIGQVTGNNLSGFTALLSGWWMLFNERYVFGNLGFATSMLGSNESSLFVIRDATNTMFPSKTVNINSINKTNGYSVRCIKDVLPSSPSLVKPFDNASNVDLTNMLEWEVSNGANSYDLQVSRESSFVNPELNIIGINTSNYELTYLSKLTNYYWRVRANNKIGSSSYSKAYVFKTGNPPNPPNLLYPKNLDFDVPVITPLIWSKSTGTYVYKVEVASDSLFTSKAVMEGRVDTIISLDTKLNFLTKYYWHVRAVDNNLSAGNWSRTFSFTTTSSVAPQPPSLKYPDNNSTVFTAQINFLWTNSLGTVSIFQISKDSTYAQYGINGSVGINSNLLVGGLEYLTTYFWRVIAMKDSNHFSYSETRKFKVACAVLYSPQNHAVDVGVYPAFIWFGGRTALSYDLQVSTQSDFSTIIFEKKGLIPNWSAMYSTRYFSEFKFTPETKYYWRVKGYYNNDWGWSETWSFTTEH